MLSYPVKACTRTNSAGFFELILSLFPDVKTAITTAMRDAGFEALLDFLGISVTLLCELEYQSRKLNINEQRIFAMAERVQKRPEYTRRQEGQEAKVAEAIGSTATAEAGEKLKEELDALIDEIDGVLETNAEEFVKSYVQKGGE